MMVVKTFPFKDHLSLTDRLEIALEYLKVGGFYGVVTDLADAYNTNRQRVYEKPLRLSASLRDTLNRILEAFRPKPPGPESKPEETLKQRIATLEAENASLQA